MFRKVKMHDKNAWLKQIRFVSVSDLKQKYWKKGTNFAMGNILKGGTWVINDKRGDIDDKKGYWMGLAYLKWFAGGISRIAYGPYVCIPPPPLSYFLESHLLYNYR